MGLAVLLVAMAGAYLGSVASVAFDAPRKLPPLVLPRQVAASIGRATVAMLFVVAVLTWT